MITVRPWFIFTDFNSTLRLCVSARPGGRGLVPPTAGWAVVLLFGLLISGRAAAQDTLKIMSWNVLNYNTTSAQSRNQYYRTVFRHAHPDVLVVQEMVSSSAADSFYNKVVNLVFPGQFTKGPFITDPNDTGNEIYYKATKFPTVVNTPIHTVLRDISEFKLYHAGVDDTLRIYSVHLKASTGFESDRAAEVDSLRKVTNALAIGKYFMVLGDFNIYRSTEQAYINLLQDNPTDDGHFVDPLSMPGTWNAAGYAPYHTQSTRTRQLSDGGATGGLDDRFDLILYSRAASLPGKIRYLPGSLTPVGNDGSHYNDSINQLPNTAVPDSVANALYFSSDHLPVFSKFIFSGQVSRNYPVVSGWNLVSVPLVVTNKAKTSIFPSATSGAFAYSPSSGYIQKDTLAFCVGYWLKFGSNQMVTISGTPKSNDTVNVTAGWNLVGTVSDSVPVSSIQQSPPGIVSSPFYGYGGAYSPVSTLIPANAYWVKTSQNGLLILNSQALRP